MKLNNFLIFFCLTFLFSCTNFKLAEVTPCSFPNETLEKGGLLNRFISKENLDNSYKKYICKDIAGHRLVYPHFLFFKNEIYNYGRDHNSF